MTQLPQKFSSVFFFVFVCVFVISINPDADDRLSEEEGGEEGKSHRGSGNYNFFSENEF